MNLHQSIAAVLALAITFAGLAAIGHYGDAAVTQGAQHATPGAITTLPTIEVRPSAAQVRLLRGRAEDSVTAHAAAFDGHGETAQHASGVTAARGHGVE